MDVLGSRDSGSFRWSRDVNAAGPDAALALRSGALARRVQVKVWREIRGVDCIGCRGRDRVVKTSLASLRSSVIRCLDHLTAGPEPGALVDGGLAAQGGPGHPRYDCSHAGA